MINYWKNSDVEVDTLALISWRSCGRRFWLSVLPIFLAWSNAVGQGLTTGALHGMVTGESGSPIGDVLVTLTDAGTGMTRIRTSDMSGRFSFGQLAPGDYEVLVERGGYIPLRLTGVAVRPGRSVETQVKIKEATGAVTNQDVVRFAGGSTGTQPQFTQWFPRSQLTRTPFRTRELTESLRLSSTASQQIAMVEGLPGRMLGYTIDGIAHRGVSTSPIDAFATTSLVLGSFEAAELATNSIDVERSGFAGPMLNGYSRRGGRTWLPSAFGRMTAVASGEGFDDLDRPSDYQAAAMVGGPLGSDSASFLVGLEFRRYDAPFAAPWAYASEAGEGVVSAGEAQQLGLGAYLQPGFARTDAITGFAIAEWQLSEKHRFETRLSYGTAPKVGVAVQYAQPFAYGSQSEVKTLAASAALLSDFNGRVGNELRFALTSDQNDYDPQSDDVFATTRGVPFTTIVANGFYFGGSAASLSEYGRRQFTLTDALTFSSSRHQWKLGVAVDAGFIEQTRFFGAQPRAVFSSASALGLQQGFLIQPIGVPGTAEFSLNQIGGFLQDTWRPTSGLEVIAGVRYDREALPLEDLQIDVEWLRLTELSNATAPSSIGKVSPRFAIKWEPGAQGWIFGAGVGLYYGESDVAALSGAAGANGRTIRRFGNLTGWTNALPTDTIGSGRSLTILAPGFDAARSLRASAGITRSIGAQMSAHLAANYRETTNLSRYVDLNRWDDPLFLDTNGRPVYGQLVQMGELVAASPGSNRRFGGFDQVLGVNSDGRSEYSAFTFAIDRATVDDINVLASYTYSRAEDNWLGARVLTNEPQIASGIVTLQGSDWEDGRSDFDIPHRFVLSADVPAPAGIRVGALFRYESGLPFTPGVPAGVDLNGDGFTGNDPVFVGDDVADLLQRVDCSTQAGEFAERNSCRMDAVKSLDLRLSAQVTRGRTSALHVVVDALNVLQSETGLVDRALYRVNPAATIVNSGGRVGVPLIPNPQFGELQQQASLPRLLRIGVQFNW